MIDLYPHNKTAYVNAKKQLESGNETCVIHPTGTGKSLIISKFIEDNPKAKHLILAPSKLIFDEIKKHLTGNYNIQYQTYSYFLKNDPLDKGFTNFDYIFIDEFHRVGAKEWGNNTEKLLKLNPQAKKIGTSATHIRYLDDSRNMAEELFNNNIASHLTLGSAIEQGILLKPKYVSAIYDIKEVLNETIRKIKNSKSPTKKDDVESLKSRVIAWEQSGGIEAILSKHLDTTRKKIIVFCRSTDQMKIAKNLLQPIFIKLFNKILFYEIRSALSSIINAKTIADFIIQDDTYKVLFSIDMVNEGLHIKGNDTVIMLRDTISPIIYFQQIGRCFAVGQESQPLIFDLVNNFSKLNSYKNIVNGFNNNLNGSHYYSNENSVNYIVDFTDETLNIQDIIGGYSYDDFDLRLSELKAYLVKFNELPPASLTIGLWCNYMRTKEKQYGIGEDKKKQIVAAWPDFFENQVNLLFNKHFEKVKAYVRLYNKLPTGGTGLGKWCASKRTRKDKMPNDQKQRLIAIWPDFFENKSELSFNNRIAELEKYMMLHKRLPPQNHSLGGWCYHIRNEHWQGMLSKDKIKRLTFLYADFFKNKHELAFNKHITELRNFVRSFNSLPTKETGLGKWCAYIKGKRRKGKLLQEKEEQIVAIWPDFFI